MLDAARDGCTSFTINSSNTSLDKGGFTMSIYRVRFDIAGGHVHCRLFCAKHPNMTFASCGVFTVQKGEEFESLVRSFSGAEFIGDKENAGIVEASAA